MPFTPETLIVILLMSMRIMPVFVFAPPFNLLRLPALTRILLSLSLAAWLAALPESRATLQVFQNEVYISKLLSVGASELYLGLLLTLLLQISYAQLLIVGRSLDIQAGFGLALLADPSLQGRLPLIGSVFAYGFAAIFFAVGGINELLQIWARLAKTIPLGAFAGDFSLNIVVNLLSTSLLVALGLGAIVFLTLFLIDLTIAFLSRTLPQMNALVVGFQVKTLAVLLTLPLALSTSVTVYLRLVRLGFEAMEKAF